MNEDVPKRHSLAAVLIVFNEEDKLENCLKALDWFDEVIVVDGGSRDRSLEISQKYASKVLRRSFDNFSNQKNFAADESQCEWIFSLDADEVISPELKESILKSVEGDGDSDGFYVKRRNIIFGKELQYGAQGPEKILRLYRKSRGRFQQPIHEKVVVAGKTGSLGGDLWHHSLPDLHSYERKLDLYTQFEAQWLLERGGRPTFFHLAVMPILRFFYHYFGRLGFLDGYEGFLFHVLSSFYYFLKYAKLAELHAKRSQKPI